MTDAEFTRACRSVTLLLFDCDGVLADGAIIHGSDGFEMKRFSARDGMGIDLWRRAGHTCGCISGRSAEALTKRAAELHFEELHQQVSNKRVVLAEILKRRGLEKQQVAYIGDDVNDLPMVGHVGLFMTPADAHVAARDRADRVLTLPGGNGAIREAVDLILTARNELDPLTKAYLG